MTSSSHSYSTRQRPGQITPDSYQVSRLTIFLFSISISPWPFPHATNVPDLSRPCCLGEEYSCPRRPFSALFRAPSSAVRLSICRPRDGSRPHRPSPRHPGMKRAACPETRRADTFIKRRMNTLPFSTASQPLSLPSSREAQAANNLTRHLPPQAHISTPDRVADRGPDSRPDGGLAAVAREPDRDCSPSDGGSPIEAHANHTQGEGWRGVCQVHVRRGGYPG